MFFLRRFSFILLITSCLLRPTSAAFAADPGLNYINNPDSANIVSSLPNWALIIPESPGNLASFIAKVPAKNIVIRLHASWTSTGQAMLGDSNLQREVAAQWTEAINNITGKELYIEPFNELERDEERDSNSGRLSVIDAAHKAIEFTSYLRSSLHQGTIISPGLDPLNPNHAPLMSAFGGSFGQFDIISLHVYSSNHYANYDLFPGKKYIFTEFGVLENGTSGRPLYNDCQFIKLLCLQKLGGLEGAAHYWGSQANILAYIMFTFAPGDSSGSWALDNQAVVSALNGQCDNITISPETDSCDEISAFGNPRGNMISRKIDPGIAKAEEKTSLLTSIMNFFTFSSNNNKRPFVYEIGKAIEEPCLLAKDKGLGYLGPSETKIIQPPASVTTSINFFPLDTNTIDVSGSYQTSDGTLYSPNYTLAQQALGGGPYYDTRTRLSTPDLLKKKDLELKSGTTARMLPEAESTRQVNDYLCRLAASTNIDTFTGTCQDAVYDQIFAYVNPNNSDIVLREGDFTKQTPNGFVHRYDTTKTNNPLPIRASAMYCTHRPACAQDYGPVDSNLCDSISSLDESVYQLVYPKLAAFAKSFSTNAPVKVISESCVQTNAFSCLTHSLPTITGDFGDLPINSDTAMSRNKIFADHNGQYCATKNGGLFSCTVKVLYIPELGQSASVSSTVNNWYTPESTHASANKCQPVIDYSSVTAAKQVAPSKLPMGVNGPDYNPSTLEQIFNKFQTFFFGISQVSACDINWKTTIDDQGNETTLPTNTCGASNLSSVSTIIYTTCAGQQYFQSTDSLYRHLMPETANASLDQKTGDQCPVDYIANDVKTDSDLPGIESPAQMYLHGTQVAGQSTNSPGAGNLNVNCNPTARLKTGSSWLLPENW